MKWLEVVNRTDLNDKPVKNLSKNYFVCQLHFKSSDYRPPTFVKLKDNAFPERTAR